MVEKPLHSKTEPQGTNPEDIDVFLLPTHAWEAWWAGAYTHVADERPTPGDWAGSPVESCTFHSRAEGKRTYAFRTDAKRIDYTAALTKRILDHFSTPDGDGACRYRVDRVVMIGFCGTLKGDEFKLGDIGVASQVDCYMEKAKLADGDVDLCGEVYRTTLEYVRLAQNLAYLDPAGYERFRAACIAARDAEAIGDVARQHLRVGSIGIHTLHLASATLLSTTKTAVDWLRDRDRKLFMIDMESGGMMAAVWAHNQARGAARPVKSLIVRAASDFTDETRDGIEVSRPALQRVGVHNVCRFLDWMFRFAGRGLAAIPRPCDVDVGILVPLEEEFSYLVEQLGMPLAPHYDPVEARFTYSVTLENGTRCGCTFVGDMGLAQMALATDAFLSSCPGTRLLVLVGIAGSIHRDILVCDVALATSVDPYLQGAKRHLKELGPLRPFEVHSGLVEKVKRVFETKKDDMRDSYEELFGKIEKIPDELKGAIREPADIRLHCVSFASGDAVAADRSVHDALRAGERNNAVVDMESGGMYVAASLRGISPSSPQVPTLFFRGISDNASADKAALDKIEPPGILRKIAMKNACSFLFHLLRSERLWEIEVTP